MLKNNGLRIVKRRQLVDEVISQIQELISVGIYKRGEKIPTEIQFMEQLRVSRTTVREAIRVLSNNGLLEVRQGDGTYVRASSAEVEPLERRIWRANLEEVFEVRELLEIGIAGIAAINRNQEDLINMHISLDRKNKAREANDMVAYIEADIAFHRAMVIASKNTILMDIYTAFSERVADSLEKLFENSIPVNKDVSCNHWYLLQAIENKNSGEAKKWAEKGLNHMINEHIKTIDI